MAYLLLRNEAHGGCFALLPAALAALTKFLLDQYVRGAAIFVTVWPASENKWKDKAKSLPKVTSVFTFMALC